jgi:hypothetical protein
VLKLLTEYGALIIQNGVETENFAIGLQISLIGVLQFSLINKKFKHFPHICGFSEVVKSVCF